MKTVISILLVACGIIAFEAPGLVRRGMKRELMAFYGFLLFAVAISIAHALEVKIPSPLDILAIIFKPVNDWVEGLFK